MYYRYKKIAYGILVLGLSLAGCAPPPAPTQASPTATATDSLPPVPIIETPTLPATDSPPRGAEREFNTDFSKHSVAYDEILSGGPPKDGIPAIDQPKFVTVSQADEWLVDREPVVFV